MNGNDFTENDDAVNSVEFKVKILQSTRVFPLDKRRPAFPTLSIHRSATDRVDRKTISSPLIFTGIVLSIVAKRKAR
jgi:hypothetical protein